MSLLAQKLIQIRKESKFDSALSFFKFLQENGAIEVNYSQYKRIEMGQVRGKPEFVSRIGKIFPEHADGLVKAYCSDIFPEQKHLFGDQEIPPLSDTGSTPTLIPQIELNHKQVHTIGKSETHYMAYLIITLARRALTLNELTQSIQGLKESAIKELEEAEIISRTENGFIARAKERIFPNDPSPEIKDIYARMDHWDSNIDKWIQTEKIYRQALTRRISPRYLPLLTQYAESLVNLLNAADEVDSSRNETSIMFHVDFKKIKIPG